MTDTPTLIINATYRIHPDDVEALKALAQRMAAIGGQHDGCAIPVMPGDPMEQKP